MQPRPSSETSSPWLPSVRVFTSPFLCVAEAVLLNKDCGDAEAAWHCGQRQTRLPASPNRPVDQRRAEASTRHLAEWELDLEEGSLAARAPERERAADRLHPV